MVVITYASDLAMAPVSCDVSGIGCSPSCPTTSPISLSGSLKITISQTWVNQTFNLRNHMPDLVNVYQLLSIYINTVQISSYTKQFTNNSKNLVMSMSTTIYTYLITNIQECD